MENEINTNIVKREDINPSILLRSADGYYRAGTILLKDTKDGILFFKYVFSPCVVNFSFACELYFKCLLSIKNVSYKNIHKLNYLYEMLENDIQNEIKSEYQKLKNKLDFEKCINIHTNVFVEFRYMHEYYGINADPFSLKNLSKALKKVAHKLKNNYEVDNINT